MILKNDIDIQEFWRGMPDWACTTAASMYVKKLRINGLGLVERIRVKGETRFRLHQVEWENGELVRDDSDDLWPLTFANRPSEGSSPSPVKKDVEGAPGKMNKKRMFQVCWFDNTNETVYTRTGENVWEMVLEVYRESLEGIVEELPTGLENEVVMRSVDNEETRPVYEPTDLGILVLLDRMTIATGFVRRLRG